MKSKVADQGGDVWVKYIILKYQNEKRTMYVGFMDWEKEYDKVKREDK